MEKCVHSFCCHKTQVYMYYSSACFSCLLYQSYLWVIKHILHSLKKKNDFVQIIAFTICSHGIQAVFQSWPQEGTSMLEFFSLHPVHGL